MVFLFSVILFFTICIYWAWFFFSFNNIKLTPDSHQIWPPISVIVCYKNAETHIKTTIENILAQDYPQFEVIAMDDFSTDHSHRSIQNIEDPRLIHLHSEMDLPGKKQALTEAIGQSKFDTILLTDADCVPASQQWIRSMTSLLLTNSSDIVLGYGPQFKNNTWVNRFARYETFLTAWQYMSYAQSGIPYMGVGRNLMYKKSVFHNVNGFETHKNIVSGDDDLFIQAAAYDKNTSVNIDPNSLVYSASKETWPGFIQQKTRHVSTSFHYSFIHKMLLGIFASSQILFYLMAILAFINGWIPTILIALGILLKWSIQSIFHHQAMKKLQVTDLQRWFPLLDILLTLYYITLPIFSLFQKNKW